MKLKYINPTFRDVDYIPTVKAKKDIAYLIGNDGNIVAKYWINTKKGQNSRAFKLNGKLYFIGWTVLQTPEFDMEACEKHARKASYNKQHYVSPWDIDTLSCEEQKQLFDKNFMDYIKTKANEIRTHYNGQIATRSVATIGTGEALTPVERVKYSSLDIPHGR